MTPVDLWQRWADGWQDALLAFDRTLCIVALNAPAAQLLGGTTQSFAGQRLRRIRESAADALEPLVGRAFDEENVFENQLFPFGSEPFSAITHRIDGTDFVALTLHPERLGNWPTDRGWAHRELAFANRQLRAFTDNTSLGFIRWDDERRVIEWSSRAAAIFGWTFEEAYGKTYAELGLVEPDDVERVEGRMRPMYAGKLNANIVECRNRTRDGRTVNCRWFNTRLAIDNGYQVVSLTDDVTALVATRTVAFESEERFRSLFEYSPDAMMALSLDGTITRANHAALQAYAAGGDALVGGVLVDLIAPEYRAAVRHAFASAARGEASSVELRARHADGSVVPVLATLIPIVFRNAISGVHVLARDLSPIRRAQREVAAHSERLRELYLVAAAANATAENQIAATVDAGCRLLGMTSGSLYDAEAERSIATVGDPLPRRLAMLVLGTDGALAIDDLDGLPYLGDAGPGETLPRSYIGTAIDVGGVRYGSLCFGGPVKRAEPFGESDRDLVQLMGALVGSAIERGRSRARLKHLAYNDQLTALPNRAWFTDRLRDELALAAESGTRVAVMFLDLDRFKDINDTLGHAQGDRLLRMISDRLSSVVGAQGLVARMGGDEFIVLLGNDPGAPDLDALAQRIVRTIDEPLVLDGHEHFVTTSIGIAIYPTDGDDADALIKHADVAMYRAKERGRNTHQFFTPALAASLRTRISQEKTLRRALERDEFVVHYQPQYELAGGRLVALEALVRWQHPRLGLVMPDQFIPSAEVSGLIVGLGDFVLETACRQVTAWQAIVPDLRLAVNLSGRQFHQSALAAKIRGVLERTGLRPEHLEVEITESVAMSDAALSVQILEELRSAGVQIAVDDFGTGYSSLGYLRRFALDCLKIDHSFVRDIMVEPDDATIVQTVIAMAHSLGLEVCAEGVETREQLEFLRAQSCDRVQGFLFARPMPAEEAAAFISARGIPSPVG